MREVIKILWAPATHYLNDSHNYYGGAIGNIAYNFLRSISKFNIEIHALVHGADLTYHIPRNIKIYTTGNNRIKSFIQSLRLANRILKVENISLIIQLYTAYGVSFNPMLKAIKDYPFVFGPCELPHPQLEDEVKGITRYPVIRFLGKKIIFPLFKETLEHCDILIAVNKAAKDLYSNLISRSKIRIIPYGVDLERFKYSPPPCNHDILVVSRLIKRRGLDYLIEAMPLILKEYPDAKLRFVGSGPRKEILQKKAKELGINSKVIFHGNVSASELVNLYRNCYVFCHLSFADGWNQPALEAMASGRPVICTIAPHNSMVIDNKTGFLIHYGDVDALAERIMKLFSDRDLAEKMGFYGRREVEEKYNWDLIGKKCYEIYQEVR